MRILISISFLFLLVLMSCNQGSSGQNSDTINEKKRSESYDSPRLLRHIVLFKFNEQASPEKLKEIEDAFSILPSKIPQIKSFEWGINNSPEGLDKGFTHCFVVTFKTEEDRAIYLPHPEHQKFVDLIGPYVEDVTVVDYWNN